MCELTQYEQPLVAETARAIVSRVLASSRLVRPAASGCIRALSCRPDQLELIGIRGQCPPEVRHEVDALGPLDVVKDLADLAAGAVFIDQSDRGLTCLT